MEVICLYYTVKQGEGRTGHRAKGPVCIGHPCQEQVVLALQEVWLNWKGLQRIPVLQTLRRAVICSPGSLQLAVTPVGQFPTCIPHGNKALNFFGWKQLVVSQMQMATRVLSARLLGECWIDFFDGSGSGFKESCVGGQVGTGWVCFYKSFVSSVLRAEEKEQQALLQVRGSRSWQG